MDTSQISVDETFDALRRAPFIHVMRETLEALNRGGPYDEEIDWMIDHMSQADLEKYKKDPIGHGPDNQFNQLYNNNGWTFEELVLEARKRCGR